MSLMVNIKKNYKKFSLSVNFESSGEPLGLLGASGSGKSLTLKCITGIETPDQGRIILNDRVLFDSDLGINIPPRQRNIGLMFQNYALFPNKTVIDNIHIGIKNKNSKQVITKKMLSMFHLEALQQSYPGQLSGGEQQRVAMARLLAYEPEALLLDEPFSALDSYLKDEICQELKDVIDRYEKDIIMVSHSKEELYRFCDSIAVIDHGTMIELGSKEKIFDHPEDITTARLTGCRNISRATKLTDYEIKAIDWDMCIKTDRRVAEDIRYVGIHSHHLLPADHVDDNTIPVTLSDFAEGSCEISMTYRSLTRSGAAGKFIWKLSKEEWSCRNGKLPKYLFFPKEHILLLRNKKH